MVEVVLNMIEKLIVKILSISNFIFTNLIMSLSLNPIRYKIVDA